MGIKFRIEKLSEIEKDYLLRCSGKTIVSGIEIKSEIKELSKKYKFQPLRRKFTILSGYAFKSEDFSSDNSLVPVIRIGDIGKDDFLSDCVFIGEEFLQSQKDFILKQDDILVGLTGDGKLKCSINEGDNPKLLNQRVGALRPKEEDININFYYYLLNSSIVKKQFLWYSNGKTQLNISPFDFLKIKVPEISKIRQDEIIKELEPIELKIKQLKSAIKPVQEVIDEVFTRELGFNKAEFLKEKDISNFGISISDFGNNRDLRNSCKFHRPSAYMLQQFLSKKTNLKVKHFLSEDIVLGAGVSPSDMDENGDYRYISMATIKDWALNYEEANAVSNEYSNQKIAKNIRKGDILIARSGEGTIGKVALIEDDYDGIFADFVMRVRLQGCNLKFAYYYFRSFMFQYLIEIHKKGLGNNTNIFPTQIRELPFPNMPLADQEKIVREIQAEIDEQDKIRKDIQQERNKIDEIIENAIR